MSRASPASQKSLAQRVDSLPTSQRLELAKLLTPRWTRYIPHQPHPPQAAFLLLTDRQGLFGGAAGGGKSDALLMGALQYVDVPGYSALILRRRHVDLVRADALIPRSHSWLANTDASWNGDTKMWTFPSGATLEFGHCENENDRYNYQGSAWQYIGFDEVTHFTESQYLYVGLSRGRRLTGSLVPLRTRATANPGGIGHEWVLSRFVDPDTRVAPFIPARLEDNPSLDGDTYRESLQQLSAVERARLLDGDWRVRPRGPLFQREWFRLVDESAGVVRRVRFWDLAATEAGENGNADPDWTAGVRLGLTAAGDCYVEHAVRVRARPKDVEALVLATAERDGRDVAIGMEQEGGASGKSTVSHYARNVLRGYRFVGVRKRRDKVACAELWQPSAERGEIRLVRGRWVRDWLDEVEAFPAGGHDDYVDATSGAWEMLASRQLVDPSEVRESVLTAPRRGLAAEDM